MCKTRKGFVSNSSSSSFICDLSGEAFESYDGLSECDAVSCANDHVFFYQGYPEVEAWVDDEEKNNDEEYGRNYNMPAHLCPICNGSAKEVLVNRMKAELKRLNLTAKDLS